MQLGAALLLVGFVVLLVGMPVWLASLRSSLRAGLLIGYVALLQFVPGTVVAPYSIPLTDGLAITPANLLVAGAFLAAVLLVLVERDPITVRLVVLAVLFAGLLELALLASTEWALTSGQVDPLSDVRPDLYGRFLDVLLAGTPLVVLELALFVLASEWIRRSQLDRWGRSIALTGVFVAILLLDGLLFTGLVAVLEAGVATSVAGGVARKAVIAVLFGVPLLGFLRVSPAVWEAAGNGPLRLRDVVFARRQDLVQRLQRQERERLELLERAVRVGEEERTRLAGELHDEAIQLLTAADLRLQAAALDREDDQLGRVRLLLRDGVNSLRRLILQLRSQDATATAFGPLVAAYADRLFVDVDVDIEAALPDDAPPEVVAGAYRITLEALSNAARHAAASRVVVRVHEERGVVVGAVRDDGVGIPPDAETGPGHLGLRAMQERATALGGRVTVVAVAEGTLVRFELPATRVL